MEPSTVRANATATEGSSQDQQAHAVVDVQRLASLALDVAARLVSPGSELDVTDPHVGGPGVPSTYRVRAVGDALVIQRSQDAVSNPFCGLLVTPSTPGHLPRLLFDMGTLANGTPQLAEAERMLQAVVRRASLS